MEGWRQRRPGSNGRNPQKGKEKKEKKHLTHTGLLMEGTKFKHLVRQQQFY
jgi:hypothetical protein